MAEVPQRDRTEARGWSSARRSLGHLGMRAVLPFAIVLASTHAHADVPSRYVGASFELSNGYQGRSEFGLMAQVAPTAHIEVEAGAIKHHVDGGATIDAHDVWMVSGAARAKLPLRGGALFAGLGVTTGEHGEANGCVSSGFVDFCGAQNNTFVYRHWDRATWLRAEVGGEVAVGPIAARLALAPVFQLGSPTEVEGCAACSSGDRGFVITMGIHGRIPL
jgi:hypothetical protein